MSQDDPRSGPFEDLEWPSRLTARVVKPGARPELHGYDVQGDVAVHFTFGELALIALAGSAPDRATGRAFEVALVFAAPCSIAEAPAHAAMLVRLCGARAAGVVSTACIALAEQARDEISGHADLLAWLGQDDASRTRPLPAAAVAASEDEREAVRRLARALPDDFARPRALAEGAGLSAAIVCVLYACGLRSPEQLEAALCHARFPAVIAEALAAKPGDFRAYPSNLPPFRYEEP